MPMQVEGETVPTRSDTSQPEACLSYSGLWGCVGWHLLGDLGVMGGVATGPTGGGSGWCDGDIAHDATLMATTVGPWAVRSDVRRVRRSRSASDDRVAGCDRDLRACTIPARPMWPVACRWMLACGVWVSDGCLQSPTDRCEASRA